MPGIASERLARFHPLVAEVMAEWRIPGLAMAVVRRGEPPALRCWGVCDIDTGAPVTTDTVFPICSVTKSFTATALRSTAPTCHLPGRETHRRVVIFACPTCRADVASARGGVRPMNGAQAAALSDCSHVRCIAPHLATTLAPGSPQREQ